MLVNAEAARLSCHCPVGVQIFGLREVAVLYYALVFLVIAIIAGMLGFGVVAFAAAGIAKICFFIFLILFLLSFVRHISSHV